MKKKRLILLLILLIILLVPIPIYIKDGGTVEYKSILYSVSKVHRLKESFVSEEYEVGLIIKILGLEIFNNVK